MSDRPIFVIGCPRSGTTMLQLMLHSHPRISVPPETRFLIPAYYRRRTWGDLRLDHRRRALAQWIATDRSTKFRELKLDKDEFIREAVDAPGSLGSVIGTAFRMYADRFDKARWGDKRPSYVKQVDLLLRLFPDAQFVHLIRDGRDCVASLKEMPWYTLDSFHAVSTWAEAIDAGGRLRRTLPADTYYELRYEDLTDDPMTELKKLCHFLEEDFSPSMISPREAAIHAVPQHKVWHSNTHGEVTRSRVGSWADRLDDWEIALCEHMLGDRLESMGYELTGAPKPAKEHVTAAQKTMQKRKASRMRKGMRDRINRLREPSPVAAMLTTTQRSLAGIPQQRPEMSEPAL
ncbi:sulfotransferase family protein [Nonomuraea jiangxiensis]|uniref:Sulfotransferase family protein n=1 Tax=Nonomuraea jiangxiensis TaxID=633440 RepID=A0A1G8FZ57_9ACTN|nr:sulfotransferase [Nonomuraea jiangxiensis]SDH87438.1 Sulfotransferase family protein [Nonomuraea jiangxiensis]